MMTSYWQAGQYLETLSDSSTQAGWKEWQHGRHLILVWSSKGWKQQKQLSVFICTFQNQRVLARIRMLGEIQWLLLTTR